jgi:hypothetical protein
MLRDKRTTRGLRMADLVGQAAEDDDQFWNADVWNEEGSDQDSFSEEEVKPDEFDEDFNDTETEDEEGSDEDAKVQKAGKSMAMKVSPLILSRSIRPTPVSPLSSLRSSRRRRAPTYIRTHL